MPQAEPSQGAKTLDTGLRVLLELRAHPDGLMQAELARALGVERTAVHRLLRVLQARRFVERTESGRYHLGLGLVELTSAVRPRLRVAAERELRALADDCGATAFVTVLDGDSGVVISVAEPRRLAAHVAYRVGTRHPITRGASGVAILAGRPAQQGERDTVARARADGYAVTRGELEPGAWGLAVPIRPGGAPAEASVGVVALAPLDAEAVAARVHTASQAIAETLRT